MCGRYTLTVQIDELGERFGCPVVEPVHKPRYNVAPLQTMPVVIGQGRHKRFQMMQWGLVPFWAKDQSIGNKLINARLETITQKSSFKYAVRERRCIVPADGYYEWLKTDTGKQPMRITIPSNQLFGLAGVWEQWRRPDGEWLYSYSIITTSPVPSLSHIHHRMPLVISCDQEDYWLNGYCPNNMEDIQSFFGHLKPVQTFIAYPVSNRVNSVRNDDLQCIQAV